VSRRTPLVALLAVLATLALAACGGGSDGSDRSSSTSSTTSPSAGGASAGSFPAVVEHQFGTTTVPAKPTRVVSVGLTEQDVLLQLGVVPVATTEWYGEQPSAVWPWARDLLGDAKPQVLSNADGLQFEKIAALKPDLIIGTNAGMKKRDYELLSAIAPTVSSVKGSTAYFSPWQDQVLQVARALGREADGQELIDEVEDDYAEVAAEHPEWKGRTATFSQGGPYDGELYVYPDGLSTDFLTRLGFEITPGLQKYAPDIGSQAQISGENVDLLEADVVVWATEDAAMFKKLMAFSTVSRLPAVKEGRSVYTDEVLAGALYFLTPLSLEYALDRLTPMLERAARGEAPRAFPS
jgi:iron complex transport system substrate-binding protein